MRKWNDQTYKYTSSRQSFPKFLITPAVCLLSLVHSPNFSFVTPAVCLLSLVICPSSRHSLNFLSVVTNAVCLLSLVICPVRMEKIRKFLSVASVSWRYRHEVCVLRDGRTCFPRSIMLYNNDDDYDKSDYYYGILCTDACAHTRPLRLRIQLKDKTQDWQRYCVVNIWRDLN